MYYELSYSSTLTMIIPVLCLLLLQYSNQSTTVFTPKYRSTHAKIPKYSRGSTITRIEYRNGSQRQVHRLERVNQVLSVNYLQPTHPLYCSFNKKHYLCQLNSENSATPSACLRVQDNNIINIL